MFFTFLSGQVQRNLKTYSITSRNLIGGAPLQRFGSMEAPPAIEEIDMTLAPNFRRALAASAALWTSVASAAIISETLYFEAVDFGVSSGAPPDAQPSVSPVSGFVSYRFDNSATFLNQSNGALVNGHLLEVSAWGLNVPWDGSLKVSYLKAPPNPLGVFDTLAFSQAPTTSVDYGVDDWRLMVTSVSTEPTFLQFWYSPKGAQFAFGPATGMVRAVPEPATPSLLLAGIVGLVIALRRVSSGVAHAHVAA